MWINVKNYLAMIVLTTCTHFKNKSRSYLMMMSTITNYIRKKLIALTLTIFFSFANISHFKGFTAVLCL